MKKEQMVGTRLPDTVVRDLEAIEQVEQADRSTTVRKLLSRAIQDWKLESGSTCSGSRFGGCNSPNSAWLRRCSSQSSESGQTTLAAAARCKYS